METLVAAHDVAVQMIDTPVLWRKRHKRENKLSPISAACQEPRSHKPCTRFASFIPNWRAR
jgi:hypothetical protein